jgi:hypothetical protein
MYACLHGEHAKDNKTTYKNPQQGEYNVRPAKLEIAYLYKYDFFHRFRQVLIRFEAEGTNKAAKIEKSPSPRKRRLRWSKGIAEKFGNFL